jgi:hypothetical protein
MIRGMMKAGLIAGFAAGWAVAPAAADEPVVDASELQLTGEGGALDSAALDGVSGGALMGEPTSEAAWRDADGYAYPLDIPGTVQPAGSGIADAATLGAEMGSRPPGGDALGTAGGIAGDIAHTIF